MSGIGDLVISIAGDLAALRESMTQAEYLTQQTAQKIDATMGKLEASLKGVAAGYLSFKTIEAFAENIEGAIEATAALHKLEQQTGVSGEALSGLRSIARLSGTEITEVATGLQRMSKNMVDAASGTGKAIGAFQSLKLNVRDSSGALKESDSFLLEVAQKLEGLDSETQKVAFAMQIFGRSGAQLLPFLHDLAEAGEIEAKKTRAQIAEAHEYELTMRKLTAAKKELFSVIASQLTPVLTALGLTLLETRTQAGGLNDTVKKMAAEQVIRNWAIDAAIGFTTLLDKIIDVGQGFAITFQAIGRALGVVGVFFAEVFDNISFAIVHAGETLESFGKVVLGASMMMAGNFAQGFLLVREGMQGLSADAKLYGDKLKSSWGNISGAVSSFVDDAAAAFDSFKKSDITGLLVNHLGEMSTAVDKFKPKGTDHAEVVRHAADSYDKLLASLDKTLAKLQAESAFMDKYGFATHETMRAVVEAQLAEESMTDTLEKHALAHHKTVKELKAEILARADEVDAVKHALETKTEYANLVRSENEQLGQTIENLKDEAATYGMLTSQVSAYRMAKLLAQRADVIDGESQVAKDLDYQIGKWREIIRLQKDNEGMKAFIAGIQEAAGIVGDIAKGFTESWSKGIDVARQKFKAFLQEVIALLAKKLFLNIVANMVGGSTGASLASSAAQLGSNTLAGSSIVGAYGAATNFFAGMSLPASAVGAGAIDAGVGVSATSAAGLGSYVGAAAQGAGLISAEGALTATGYGAIIAVALIVGEAIWSHFADKGENWQATLGFGPNARAYTTQGVFGPEGFESIQGTDAQNRALQSFMASTSLIDHIIAGTLSAATIATITAHLAGPYTTRNDGQPAQFAFGAGDATAGAQLSLEYLQHKYGIIFDSIDTQFAAFVRSFTGTSQDLLTAIANEANFLNSISVMADSIGLHGLTLSGLQAMQRAGESLQQTLENVANSFNTYTENFYTDAERRQIGLEALGAQFQALGVEMPKTRDEFRHLVETTDHNSPLFRALLELAPTFAALVPPLNLLTSTVNSLGRAGAEAANALGRAVTSAFQFGHIGNTPGGLDDGSGNNPGTTVDWASAAASQFDTIRTNITNLFSGSDLATAIPGEIRSVSGYIDTYTRAWHDAVSRGDTTSAQGLSQLITQLTDWRESLRGDLAHFLSLEAAHPGHGQALLDLEHWHSEMTGLFSGNAEAMLEIERIYGERRRAIIEGTATDTSNAIAQAMAAARRSLRDFLDSLDTSPDFSTLTPDNRFAQMGSDLMDAASAAATDPQALSRLPGMAQAYLQLARTLFASGPGYNIALDFIRNLLGPLSVDLNTAPAATEVTDTASAETRDAVRDLINVIGLGLTVSDPEAQDALRRIASQLDRARVPVAMAGLIS